MNRIVLTNKGQEIITRANVDGNPQYWVGYFGLAYVPEQSQTPLAERTTLVGQDENGDYIYNIWQGDLTGTGNASAKADSGFTGLTAYDSNLSANFRYVYDQENLCNRLVAWETEGEAADGVKADSFRRKGYAVYEGCKATESTGSDTDTVHFSTSSIPVPAPLLYLGSSLDYSGDMTALAGSLGIDWPMMTVSGTDIPMVTPDMRCYGGKVNPASPGTASIDQLVDSETARDDQYVQDGCMANYANMVSASVYNKGHCQVSSEGYETDYQESCHNMSRVTKLFPISQYEVADVDPETKSGRKGDASTIKYHLSLDFKGLNATYNDVLNFHGEGSELYDGSCRNSFKFNRIGIYAVPVSVRRFRKEGGCDLCQVEVEPEKNPVLVAIITVDEVLLSEDGSIGFTSWSQDFILNMNTVPADSGSLIRDVEVYYNLAENEAITWYQNQLLATAGLSEAVTSLGIDVAYLKNMAPAASATCCQGAPAVSGDSAYASIYHTHDYLKNLVDALGGTGAVRGVNSLAADGYGESSFTMGFGSQTTGNFAITNGPNALNDGDFSINIGASAKNYGGYSINMGWPGAINNADRSINIGGGKLESSNTGNIIQMSTSGGLKEASSNSLILTTTENIDRLCRSVILTGDTTTGTVETENVITDTLWIGADSDKLSGAKVSQSVMIGNSNTCNSQFILEQVFSVGNTHIMPDSSTGYDGQATINRTTIIGLNRPVIGYGLTGKEHYPNIQDLCTHTYSDAHIFLNSDYFRIPELFGIFPGPTKPRGNYGTGVEDIRNQYMPLQRDAFNYDGTKDDYKYEPEGSPRDPTNSNADCDAWANGKYLTAIRTMINKPSVPMIYTGGIALAGNAIDEYTSPDHYGDEPYAGRLKLGSGVLPTAYIVSHSVASWNRNQRFIIPASITGTTICPYGRMKLGITDVQELDGTLHIGLFRDAGMTTNYHGTWFLTLPPGDIPQMGGVYLFDNNSSYTTLPAPRDNYHTGDEFIVIIADSTEVQYPAIGNVPELGVDDTYVLPNSKLSGPGRWLLRIAMYTYEVLINQKTYSMYGYIALPIGGEHPTA